MQNLTNKRLGEAKSLGFDIPGFSRGGTLPKGLVLSQKAAFDHVYNLAKKAGANILVSGSTIFKENKGDLKKNIEILKKN